LAASSGYSDAAAKHLAIEADLDLREQTSDFTVRHPWELARATLLRSLLSNISQGRPTSVLDVGCGDGFTLNELFSADPSNNLTGLDINFTAKQLQIQRNRYPSTRFVKNLAEIEGAQFDFLLLLDVLEHVEDDSSFLKETVKNHLSPGGQVLITVPAIPALFSSHDRFLGHQRRYRRNKLLSLVEASGLECLYNGYLFSSLLPIRATHTLLEKLAPTELPHPTSLGNWRGGQWITRMIAGGLEIEGHLSLALRQLNILVPGLTVYALCKKQ
jgi:2-polyprenyl-3-methyl-5-hydroxy-6-metoxy-1,4-benzoquinol methylase